MSIDDIGRAVSYREAALLIAVILRDPESWTQATKAGWTYPVSREWIVASHTYDLLAMANSGKGKKPKPYPNPFPNKDTIRTGKTQLPPQEVRKILDWMNPKED